MKKTILVILISIVVIIVLAIIFSIFFAPQQKLRYNQCVLLQNPKTGQIDCFGCANNICKDADLNWIIYENQAGGKTYTCASTPQGCELAQ
jgi:hypothetical protein